MSKKLLTIIAGIAVLVAAFFLLNNYIYNEKQVEDAGDGSYACNADAKICPDGSLVGRTGPQCVFEACPDPDRKSAEVMTYLGGSTTALNVTVSPQEIISDSRCPVDVNCVWAGTVEVRTTLSTQVAHGEHVMKLGEPQVFGDFTITLTEVTPEKTEESITESSYRFTYNISRN